MAETIACKKCGADIPVNPGYISWCDKCEWNIDPSIEKGKETTLNKINIRLGKKFSQTLLDSMINNVNEAPRLSVSLIIAYFLSALIYLANFSLIFLLVYSGIKIITIFPGIVGVLIAIICFSFAYVLFPRFRKMKTKLLDKSEIPKLYDIVNTICKELGAKSIDGIIINGSFNAAFSKTSFKRKRILTIGLPLFEILDSQEKVALIAHELAHSVNNDVRRGIIIGGALNLVARWYNIIAPDTLIRELEFQAQLGLSGIASVIINTIRWCISRIFVLLWYALSILLWRDCQRSEYLADYLAASVSGTDAMLSTLEKLHFGYTFHSVLENAARYQHIKNVFNEFRYKINNVPERENDRIKRITRSKQYKIDSTHPPTKYRIDYLQAKKSNPKVILNDQDIEDLDKELEAFRRKEQAKLVDYYRAYVYG